MQEQLPEARAFSPVQGCTVENPGPASRTLEGRSPEGRVRGVSFLWPTLLWTSTAPQERRERRRRPEGRRAGCPESRKVGRPPLRATKPAKAWPEGERVRPPWRSQERAAARSRWIPASAGMTSKSTGSGLPPGSRATEWDPGFRRDDEQQNGTPAEAGTTITRDIAGAGFALPQAAATRSAPRQRNPGNERYANSFRTAARAASNEKCRRTFSSPWSESDVHSASSV
jgi:hypothetical protein